MKSFTILSTLAAGAAATGFLNANPFTCPSNTDNKCTDKQHKGWDFDGDDDFNKQYPIGKPIDAFDGFGFKGFTCGSGPVKRSPLGRRTFGKAIGATCGSDKASAPAFGCQKGSGFDKFSLGEIHVQPEFSCDLELHYGMPDGSNCKQRKSCDHKKVNTIKNDQCGGATSVTIVYPSQTGKPKPSCSITVPSVSFSCDTTTKTKPTPSTYSTSEVETTPTPETSSTYKLSTTSTSPVQTTRYANSSTATTSTSPVETTSTYVETPSSSTVVTTSYMSTSTVFTTLTSTITSCAEAVTNCPAESQTVTTTVVTVGVSTTICPVTETHTIPVEYTQTKPHPTKSEETTVISSYPVESTSTTKVVPTTTKPSSPIETLPCPSVVPQCLNTWLFVVGCKDNTDHACYCPNTIFVENIFSCIYSHGETDTVISEAIIFFQGICAPYIPGNPAVATGATVTTYLTVTAPPTVTAVYTTVTVQATTVVPCTNEIGSTIPGSSTTVYISTQMSYPQVGFTTGSSGSVGVIPVTTPVQAGVSTPATAVTTAKPVATGTGSYLTPKPTTSGIVTVNAGGRTSSGFGLAGLAVMAVVAAM